MSLGRKFILLLLRLYKLLVSPALHALAGPMGGCRYTPTCSDYAAEAVVLHGVVRGTWLAVRRICRCNPWGGCGHDPVPKDFVLEFTTPRRDGAAPAGCGCHHVHTRGPAQFGCPPPVL